jgi:hypothetical protein
MSGPEAKIERAVVDQAEKHGWIARKVRFDGVNGSPDRWFGKIGEKRHLIIEFKQPGEVPTRQQFKRMNELRQDFGFTVVWVDSYAWACAELGIPE